MAEETPAAVVLTSITLAQIMPQASVAAWVDPLNDAAERFQLNTKLRMAAWLAQVAAESTELTELEENLHYSADRLLVIFPREFPDVGTATAYAGSPIRIANRVYSGLYGNGNEQSGDGWFYRGRGPIQITFKDNYRDASAGIGDPDLLGSPDRMLTPTIGARAAAWYFVMRHCVPLADAGNIDSISRRVNGPSEQGRLARARYYQRAMVAL